MAFFCLLSLMLILIFEQINFKNEPTIAFFNTRNCIFINFDLVNTIQKNQLIN